MRIRALIVDDEPLARRRLRSLLRSEPDIDLAGECGDGRRAVAAILEKKPDLVFLDVQMPELDGFAVLDAVGAERLPAIVFVTAYDEHALRAFEVYALDYLLKPFDRERFRRTLDRVRVEIAAQRSSSSNRELLELISELRSSSRTQQRLMVRNAGRILFLGVNEIDWIEAEGNYVRLHVGKESHLMRETMNAIEQRLAVLKFQRIHRSTIVNVERVRELQPWIRGDSVVILRDNTRLTLSRNYRERFENALSRSH
jgi:two-component system, LytTR family, response regulator